MESPGVGGMSAFNVYGESSLPENNPTLTRVRPYVYIVDSLIKPTKNDLPLIVLDISPFNLGVTELGRAAREVEVNAHVFGRNRGERDDIASYLQDYLATSGSGNRITIRDYGTTGTPQLDTGEVQLPVQVHSISQVPEFEREAASTSNHNVVVAIVRFRAK